MSSTFGQITLLSGSSKIKITANARLAADYSLKLPSTAPADNQTLKWNGTLGTFEWGVGSVTLTSTDSSSLTVTDTSGGNGTSYSLGFPSKAASLFLSSPSGGSGAPSFRAIVDGDISALDAAKLTGTVAVARIPSGTDASSWQVGVASGNVKLTADTTKFEIRKSDNSLGDLVVNKITATQVDFTTVEYVPVGDAILTLNAEYTGSTPTEDAGFEVNRGTQPKFSVLFQESTDRLVAGFTGAFRTVGILLSRTFVSDDLTGSNLVWTHNAASTTVANITIYNASNVAIGVGWTVDNSNQVTIDLTGLTISGTWSVVMIC